MVGSNLLCGNDNKLNSRFVIDGDMFSLLHGFIDGCKLTYILVFQFHNQNI